jgi:hypothetical protein
MKPSGRRFVMIAICALAGACDGPSAPTTAGYAGQWSGTTAQGKPIAFTISSDEVVTSITVEHAFNGCSGSQTFSNLKLSITPDVRCIPGPCPGGVSSFRSFSFSSGRVDGPITVVNGGFPSTNTAEGVTGFFNYPGCGSAIGVAWSASKR